MKIKQEVKQLCVDLMNARNKENGEFKRIQNILVRQYGFTPYNLMSLVEGVIEYNTDQIPLIMDDN